MAVSSSKALQTWTRRLTQALSPEHGLTSYEIRKLVNTFGARTDTDRVIPLAEEDREVLEAAFIQGIDEHGGFFVAKDWEESGREMLRRYAWTNGGKYRPDNPFPSQAGLDMRDPSRIQAIKLVGYVRPFDNIPAYLEPMYGVTMWNGVTFAYSYYFLAGKPNLEVLPLV